MSANAIDATRRLVTKSREDLMGNAAVIVAGLAVMISAFSLLFGGVALYAAYNANERISQLEEQQNADYVQWNTRSAKMDAWLKMRGVPIEEIYNE